MVKSENGVLIPEYPDFKTLYIGDITGVYCLKANNNFTVVSNRNVVIEGNDILKITVTD